MRSGQHKSNDNTYVPDIDFVVVSSFRDAHLWRHIGLGAYSLFEHNLLVRFNDGKIEVADKDTVVRINIQTWEADVAVNDVLFVDMLKTKKCLPHDESDLFFGQLLAPLQYLIDWFVYAELTEHEKVKIIFKEAL